MTSTSSYTDSANGVGRDYSVIAMQFLHMPYSPWQEIDASARAGTRYNNGLEQQSEVGITDLEHFMAEATNPEWLARANARPQGSVSTVPIGADQLFEIRLTLPILPNLANHNLGLMALVWIVRLVRHLLERLEFAIVGV